MMPRNERPQAHHPLVASSRHEETAYNVPHDVEIQELQALDRLS